MADPDRQIWDGMLAHLRATQPTICRQWFTELEPLGIAGGALQLRTHSPLHRDYLRRQCADPFNDAARTVSGRLLSVRFLGPDDEVLKVPEPVKKPADTQKVALLSTPLPKPDKPKTTPIATPSYRVVEVAPPPRSVPSDESRHVFESLIVNPDYSFESFVVGPGNRLAHAAAQAVADNPGRTYNPFFVHGGVGLGKTHLLQAVCLRIVEANPRTSLYTSCDAFMNHLFDAFRTGQMAEFHHRFRDVDVLVIDDIHFLTKRDQSQEEFFHTFNSLFQANRQIILSSDAPPEDIPQLEERLVSRFKWGLVVKIEAPDYETRIQILKAKARLRGLPMPDDVACFLAQRIDNNIRELEGAIVKLQIQSTVEKREIDLALAKAAAGEEPPSLAGEPTIQSIISAVTDFFSIRLADLQSKHRQRSIAQPRQVCMYLARKLTRHSLEEIGGFFGGRDHTTVMHAIRTVDQRRQEEPDFEAVIRSLEERVRAVKAP